MPATDMKKSIITSIAYNWPLQSYRPSPFANQQNQPSSIASAQYQKRQEALASLKGEYVGTEIDCNKCDVFVDESGREFYHPHWPGNRYKSAPAVTTTAAVMQGTGGATKAGSTPVHSVPKETGVVGSN
jgi:hypothetical protein